MLVFFILIYGLNVILFNILVGFFFGNWKLFLKFILKNVFRICIIILRIKINCNFDFKYIINNGNWDKWY